MRKSIVVVGAAALIAGSLVLAAPTAQDADTQPQPGLLKSPTPVQATEPATPVDAPRTDLLHTFLLEMIAADAENSVKQRAAVSRQAEGPENLDERFRRRFDTNHDGRMGDTESLAAIEHLRECLRKRLDADGDSQIDGPECLALQRALHTFGQPFVTEPRSLLRQFDADGNGKLTGAEKAAVVRATELHLANLRQAGGPLLDLFDADADGALGASERQAMVRCLVSGGVPPHLAERTWRDQRDEERANRERRLTERFAGESHTSAPKERP